MALAVVLGALSPLTSTYTTEYIAMVPIHSSLDYQYLTGYNIWNNMLASGVSDPGMAAIARDYMNSEVDVNENSSFPVQWMKLQYPAGATTVDAVNMTLSPDDAEAHRVLGRWSNMTIERGLALSARVDGDYMVCLFPDGAAVIDGEVAITGGDDWKRRGRKFTQRLQRLRRLRKALTEPLTLTEGTPTADDESTLESEGTSHKKISTSADECIAGAEDDGFFVPWEVRHCTVLKMINIDASKPTRTLQFKPLFKEAFPGYFEAHHQLTLTTLPGGQRVALILVGYHDPTFSNYTLIDGIVAVDLETFKLVPIADGEYAYKVKGSIAFYGDARKDAYRMQYQACDFNEAGERNCEANVHNGGEFSNFTDINIDLHANGLQRFQGPDAVSYLVITLQRSSEAVVITCPWTYSTHDQGGSVGGGAVRGSAIVQRFGTPSYWDEANYNGSVPFSIAPRRSFGMPLGSHDFTEGIHNVFYTSASLTSALRGKPTLTILANYDAIYPTPASSFVYEFEFRPVPEGSASDTGDDTVFDTSYVNLRMPFHADMQGGARPIGDGLYVVAAGDDPDVKYCVVDLKNASLCTNPSWDASFISVYDPFIRVLV